MSSRRHCLRAACHPRIWIMQRWRDLCSFFASRYAKRGTQKMNKGRRQTDRLNSQGMEPRGAESRRNRRPSAFIPGQGRPCFAKASQRPPLRSAEREGGRGGRRSEGGFGAVSPHGRTGRCHGHARGAQLSTAVWGAGSLVVKQLAHNELIEGSIPSPPMACSLSEKESNGAASPRWMPRDQRERGDH